MYSVYRFTNKLNNKQYIGLTKNIKRRFSQHKRAKSRSVAFCHAIRKYGFENFTFEVLKENLVLKEAKELEVKLIKEFNTLCPNGYNRTIGGDSSVSHSPETIKKIVAKNKLYWKTHKHPMQGKKHSFETRMKLSIATKNREHPKGKAHWNFGNKYTEEKRKLISERNALGNNPFAKQVIDLKTGIIYSCINEAKVVYGLSHSFISMLCTGKRKSLKYNFKYLKDYEKKTS